jgi:hypothetical protein
MQIGNPTPSGAPAPAPAPGGRFLSSVEGELALIVIAFGIVVIIAVVLILRAKLASPDDTIRCLAITMIITGTLFLICAGYTNDQIAPAVGLFGTIAGYLIGKRESHP